MSKTSLNPNPTEFAELNALLNEFVVTVMTILGENFVGAYLQGSFAVGDADLHSDCDFIVVTHGAVTPQQEAQLRALHDEIPTRAGFWAHHLEGSYAPKDELRTLAGLGREWLYIDHGWRAMQWSTHCNTEVVRWSLRECGVTLIGPPPAALVDVVPPSALQAKMREMLSTFLPDLTSWIGFDLAWTQRYAVSSICRMLYTLHTGAVASKKASLLWARDCLDVEWRELIQLALDERARGWDPADAPRPGSVEATLAFLAYAQRSAGLEPSAF